MIDVASLAVFDGSWKIGTGDNNHKLDYEIDLFTGIVSFSEILKVIDLYGFCIIRAQDLTQSNEIIKLFDTNLNRLRQNSALDSYEFMVKPKEGSKTLVSRNDEQPLHTDMGYTTFIPQLIVLQCIKSAVSGGYSLIVPVDNIERHLRGKFDSQIDLLFEDNAITYLRNFQGVTKPVFKKNINLKSAISFTLFAHMIKGKTNLHEELFKEIIEFAHDENNQIRFMLNDNDILLIQNDAALHGRTSFVGERVLRRIWYQN